jgi:hypothetical protein
LSRGLQDLRDLCKYLSVEDNVEFRVNLGYPELLQELADGLIGEHSILKYFLIYKRFSSLDPDL